MFQQFKKQMKLQNLERAKEIAKKLGELRNVENMVTGKPYKYENYDRSPLDVDKIKLQIMRPEGEATGYVFSSPELTQAMVLVCTKGLQTQIAELEAELDTL